MTLRSTLARALALALLAAPAAVALEASPSQAATTLSTSVTITLNSTGPIQRGQSTSISGAVKDSTGDYAYDGTVELQASPYPFTSWTRVATEDAGSFYFSNVTPGISTRYRVVYSGHASTSAYADSYRGSTSNLVGQGVARKLTIKHKGLHMWGKVSPAKKKLKIVFKRLTHHKLHHWFSVKTNKKGKFSKHISGRSGTKFAVIVPGSGGYVGAAEQYIIRSF